MNNDLLLAAGGQGQQQAHQPEFPGRGSFMILKIHGFAQISFEAFEKIFLRT